jgi:beta-glucosidase
MSHHRFSMTPGLVVLALLAAGCSERPEGRNVTGNVGGSDGSGGSGPSGSGGTDNGGGSGTGGSSSGSGGATGTGGLTGTGGMTMVMPDDPSCMAYTAPRANVLSPEDPEVATILQQMTLNQKIDMVNGGPTCPNYDCDFEGTGIPSTNPPVPDFKMRDGPRGVHVLSGGPSTTWAVAEARAAAFDWDLEYRVGKLQGIEMRALKFDLSLSPVINTMRHPAWARAQETYGEDPLLVGQMGAAFTRGLQESVPACPKHFVGNDTDNNRNSVIATMDEQTLRENYALPFQIVVEQADPACIMAAYNGVNGQWCTENDHLLTEILRDDWGWKGFVVSDWWATKGHGDVSMNAGLDIEMPDKAAFQQLPSAVQQGRVMASRIDEAASRILNARIKWKELTNEYKNSAENSGIVNEQSHKDLARETEEKGAVLLKNDGILPLGSKATDLGFGSAAVKSIIFLGPDATLPDSTKVHTANAASGLGDRGSSDTNAPYSVSFLKGIQTRAGSGITVTQSGNAADAGKADVAIIPVSMAHEDEGEAFDGGKDRTDLTLGGAHPRHWATKPTAFITQAAAANPNVIVLLMVGSAVVMEDWMGKAKGIVQTFYPGQEGGTAVAKLLFGDINFSGKLPFTVAQSPGDYPNFQNNVDQAQVDYWHGYRKLEHDGKTPRFFFGYGASYTTYEYSDLKVLCSEGITDAGRLNVEVTVKNTGKMAGDEIVQLYIGYPNTTARRPKKELKAFTRVSLGPGESKPVQLSVAAKDMAYWGTAGWVVEKVAHEVLVGPSSDPSKLLKAEFTIK